MPTALLANRKLVRIGGPEATPFLQSLITLDVEALESGEARAAALLTPQGKILFDFLISRDGGDGYLVDLRGDTLADFLRRMMLYRLRAQVTLDEVSGRPVHAAWGEAARNAGLRDARFPEGVAVARLYDLAGTDTTEGEWDAVRVEHGIVESGRDYALSDAFPHDVLMDLNGGVAFAKGCFVGQEVVSRMKHRKSARRRVAILSGDGNLPEPGTPVQADGRPVGALGTVAGTKALAILRTDKVADALAGGKPVTAGSIAVTPELPAWTGLAFEAAPEGGA